VEAQVKKIRYKGNFRIHARQLRRTIERGLILWEPNFTHSHIFNEFKRSKWLDEYIEHEKQILVIIELEDVLDDAPPCGTQED